MPFAVNASRESLYCPITVPERFTGDTLFCFIDPLLVLIEYVPFGDLLGYLRKSRGLNDTYYNDPDVKPQTSLTAEQLMKFAWQVADGMCYLSSKKVCFEYAFEFTNVIGYIFCLGLSLNKASQRFVSA